VVLMEYNVISGDSHVDMSWLPGQLFVENNSQPHLQDLMPRIIETPEGLQWIAEKDNILGVAQSAGFEFMAPTAGRRKRTDKMLAAGFYDGPARPVEPDLRLKDMKTDGVDCEILYGITGSGKNLKNMEVVTEVYHVYNDWVDRFASSMPGRWYGLACLPIHDPKLAAEEVYRMTQDHEYIRGADLMAGALTYPLYARDGYWDELWKACAETNTPLSFHIGGGRMPITQTPGLDDTLTFTGGDPGQNEHAYQAVRATLGMFSQVQVLTSVIFSGACERHPDLRFIMGESGAGWVPFALSRMDHAYDESMYEKKFTSPPMPMLPSEYWHRQGYTTFQEEETAGQVAHLVGIDNMMWGSDYPHPDSVWPDSLEIIQKTLGNLEASDRKKIIRDNALNLYKIGQPK
jgi:predicted TIM-barrel fold metal-dependent hydrolase